MHGHYRVDDGHGNGVDDGHMTDHGHTADHGHMTDDGHLGVACAIDGTALAKSQAGGEQQTGEEELQKDIQ